MKEQEPARLAEGDVAGKLLAMAEALQDIRDSYSVGTMAHDTATAALIRAGFE